MKFSVIVPTLNESQYLPRLLGSLRAQTVQDFQVIVVDGGSLDSTSDVAKTHGADIFVLGGSSEFAARNYGAKHAKGSMLVFTCADVILPDLFLEKIESQLESGQIIAITGPDIPYDGDFLLRLLYSAYNILRLVSTKLPHPLKAFSTSTNFLAMRSETFTKIGGFRADDVNADGLIGRSLVRNYRILFDNNISVYISARRASGLGLARFLIHYIYVLENFFPALSSQRWFAILKNRSSRKHRELHSPK